MAHTTASRLEVHHFDDRVTTYDGVSYCLWRDGVTVYQHGVEIARHDDVRSTVADTPAAVR